jgi:5-methyltetrahydropteroyltriglutamate--homocysteine methyltransferase
MERSVQATLTGIHPRSEELVQATRDVDRGRADAKHLAEVRRKDAQALVDLQHKAGFTHITEGLLGFQDLYRPFAERVEGLQVGTLTRHFDNNTFYRQPQVVGTLRRRQDILKPYLEQVKPPAGSKAKVILPGPLTFAKAAHDTAYGSAVKLLQAFARDVLAPEVHALAKQGVGWVQFSEPALAWERPQPEELDALQKAYLTILDGVPVTSSVASYYGDVSRSLQELFDLPVDYVGIDFYETPIEALKDFQATRGLQAGLVDGRSSIVESVDELVSQAEQLLEWTDAPALALAPNCELEFVPRTLADEKVLALGEAAKQLEAGA